MSGEAKYVTWSPSSGGWNKYHIARANDYGSGVSLRPLCGGNQGATRNKWWFDLVDKVPLSEPTPLEKYSHQCEKCQTKWWSLRVQEGYPTEGIFGEHSDLR